jgi:hypothetical protein
MDSPALSPESHILLQVDPALFRDSPIHFREFQFQSPVCPGRFPENLLKDYRHHEENHVGHIE